MTWQRARSLLLIAASLTSACVAAPAVRTSHYGAPGRMEAGMVEASGNVTWSDLDLSGGPMIGYGVTDAVSIEAGAEAGSLPRAIGYAGVRYTPLRPEGRDYAFTLDLEGGAGAGVGGNQCEGTEDVDCDALNWRRPAGGGYVGIGIGGKIKWFSPYLRLRTQASVAEGIPVTSLTTAGVGVQFSIARLAHIYAGTGAFLLANQSISPVWGWGRVDAGLSFTIATPRTLRLRAQREKQAR
ncbi:MAG TPA: hypothetical protein VM869_11875 [Enhygromyxa sp.]|nr:hypothetical protein [Enhygromyxa sp.]